jgi:hypothetical protein
MFVMLSMRGCRVPFVMFVMLSMRGCRVPFVVFVMLLHIGGCRVPFVVFVRLTGAKIDPFVILLTLLIGG